MMTSRKIKQKLTILVVYYIFSFLFLYLLFFAIGVWILLFCVRFLCNADVRSNSDFPDIAVVVLLAGSVFLLYQMVRSLFQPYKADSKNLKELSREDMPELFLIIDQVAKFVKTKPPVKVYLSSSATASVFLSTSSTIFFSPRKKRLEIGIGLINILTLDELKAIIAHELGHFSQRSMFLGGYVYGIEQAIYFIGNQTDNNNKTLWQQQVRMLHSIFHAFTQVILWRLNRRFRDFSLELEYEADRLAAECVGVDTLRSVLLKTYFASAIYAETIDILGNWAINGKCIADIYKAHSYAMDAYLSVFGQEERFEQSLWTKSPVLLSLAIRSRLERLEESASAIEKKEQQWQKSILDLKPLTTHFTKYIYEQIYRIDFEQLSKCTLFSYRKWIVQYYIWLARKKGGIKQRELHINLSAKLHRLPLVDTTLDIYIDNKQIGSGSFKRGISLTVSIGLGKHLLSIICYEQLFMNEKFIVKDGALFFRLNLDYAIKSTNEQYHFFIIGDRILGD